MKDEEFEADFQILEVIAYDVVLGLSWLKTIHQAYWYYDNLSMTF